MQEMRHAYAELENRKKGAVSLKASAVGAAAASIRASAVAGKRWIRCARVMVSADTDGRWEDGRCG